MIEDSSEWLRRYVYRHGVLQVAKMISRLEWARGPQTPMPSVAAQAQGLPGREAPAERAEMARVDADLLDSLLNNAGEVSIFRSRLEQQLTSVEFNLGELSRVVQRFKDQLRKLEIEVEGQILHRHVDVRPHRPDFDPLELDRYSSIQQYARALAETAADVGSVQQLIENLTRDAQGLLIRGKFLSRQRSPSRLMPTWNVRAR